jgi:hypothetical protein
MITSLIVFALSGLFVAYMFFTRRDAFDHYVDDSLVTDGMSTEERAVRTQSTLISTSICSGELDTRLRNLYQRMLRQLRAMDWAYAKDVMHRIAEYAEKKALIVISRFLNRFGKVRDVVTGKDLPKNKGSVSFFLKHMVHHKSRLDTYLPDTLEEGGQGATFKTLDPRLQKKLEINRK